jgi:hypothetical protein
MLNRPAADACCDLEECLRPTRFTTDAAVANPGITVTPISRPVVKIQSNFFGSAGCQRLSLVASSYCVRIAPVSSVDGCVRITDRARHPSGSSIGPSEACALAAWPPQKNVGTVPYPKEFHRTVVAGVPAPISGWLTVRAIRCHRGW